MTIRNRMAWPPTPEYFVEKHVNIPDLVYNLLAWVLCGDSDDEAVSADRSTMSEQKHRNGMSIAQEFMRCIMVRRVSFNRGAVRRWIMTAYDRA